MRGPGPLGRIARAVVRGPMLVMAMACLVGCADPEAGGGAAVGRDTGGGPDESATDAAYGLPAGAPDRFGFGAEARAERIAAWDIDVRPDGVGLPAGRGTTDQGRAAYMARCVACHGATGTEGPNDRLVGGSWPEGTFPQGRTVGSYWPYATTLYDYITRAMPQDRPGSLTADETYAVIAWILMRNGIIEDGATMDATSLPTVRMPARDRFVPDDRTGGPVVR